MVAMSKKKPPLSVHGNRTQGTIVANSYKPIYIKKITARYYSTIITWSTPYIVCLVSKIVVERECRSGSTIAGRMKCIYMRLRIIRYTLFKKICLPLQGNHVHEVKRI